MELILAQIQVAEFLVTVENGDILDMVRWVTREVRKDSRRTQTPECRPAKLQSGKKWIITHRHGSDTAAPTLAMARMAWLSWLLKAIPDVLLNRVWSTVAKEHARRFRRLPRMEPVQVPRWLRSFCICRMFQTWLVSLLRQYAERTRQVRSRPPLHHLIVLDGNIGCGKTTILNALKLRAQAPDSLHFILEPVASWWTLLEDLYVQLCPETCSEDAHLREAVGDRLENVIWQHHKQTATDTRPQGHTFAERGLESAVRVFCNGLRARGCLSDHFHAYFQKDYELFTRDPAHRPSLILYFRLSHAEALKRIKARVEEEQRTFEATIDLDYLVKLEKEYENMYVNRDDVIPVDMNAGESPEEVLRGVAPEVRQYLQSRTDPAQLEVIMACFEGHETSQASPIA